MKTAGRGRGPSAPAVVSIRPRDRTGRGDTFLSNQGRTPTAPTRHDDTPCPCFDRPPAVGNPQDGRTGSLHHPARHADRRAVACSLDCSGHGRTGGAEVGRNPPRGLHRLSADGMGHGSSADESTPPIDKSAGRSAVHVGHLVRVELSHLGRRHGHLLSTLSSSIGDSSGARRATRAGEVSVRDFPGPPPFLVRGRRSPGHGRAAPRVWIKQGGPCTDIYFLLLIGGPGGPYSLIRVGIRRVTSGTAGGACNRAHFGGRPPTPRLMCCAAW
jgi:hypothetical protein